MRTKVSIEGMCCKNCTVQIAKALKIIKGVLGVRVSLRTHEAIIRSTQELNEAEIKTAIEEEGYQPLAIKKI